MDSKSKHVLMKCTLVKRRMFDFSHFNLVPGASSMLQLPH